MNMWGGSSSPNEGFDPIMEISRNEEDPLPRSTDWSGLDNFDSSDPSVLSSISADYLQDDGSISQAAGTGRVAWHCDETVLNRILEILKSKEVPQGIHVFSSPPDHDTLVYYYIQNSDPSHALYVVQKKPRDSKIYSLLRAGKPKLGHDWGSSIDHQPRIHLVCGRWIPNERTQPANATASLIYRGANFNKSLKKHPFERRLKPWRCRRPPPPRPPPPPLPWERRGCAVATAKQDAPLRRPQRERESERDKEGEREREREKERERERERGREGGSDTHTHADVRVMSAYPSHIRARTRGCSWRYRIFLGVGERDLRPSPPRTPRPCWAEPSRGGRVPRERTHGRERGGGCVCGGGLPACLP